jgi:hypothetical protein
MLAAWPLAAAPTPSPANARPALRKQSLSPVLTDHSLLSADLARLVALDRRVIEGFMAPAHLDYSGEMLFVRTQDGWGGCPGMTLLHITDLLKEWEHPYTPDLSFLGIDETNANYVVSEGEAGKAAVSMSMADWTFTLQGLPSEALYHSNYDPLTPRIMQSDTAMWDPGDAVGWNEDLSPQAREEAKLYKSKISPPLTVNAAAADTVTVDDIKRLLAKYGPLYAGGWWRQINGSPDEGHVMTIVGYDDATQTLKYLNSWGNYWTHNSPTMSCGTLPYDKLYEESPGNPNIQTIMYLTNIPSAREETPDAYTARLRIQHPWRGSLNVRVGVEGQALRTVWDTRGRNPLRREENSGELVLDVPLPAYANKHWPPSSTHRWVLRVEDCDRDGRAGAVTEFTLARLHKQANCYSLGRFATQKFGGPVSVAIPNPTSGQQWSAVTDAPPQTPNPNPGVAEVFVPTAQASGPARVSAAAAKMALATDYRVRLPEDLCSMESGQLQLVADLKSRKVTDDKWSALPNVTVGFFELQQSACVNKPSQWVAVGSAKTQANGRARLQLQPSLAKHIYAATFKSNSGAILASSFPLTCDSRLPKPKIEFAVPVRDLVFPDLNLPRPSEDILRVMEHAPAVTH